MLLRRPGVLRALSSSSSTASLSAAAAAAAAAAAVPFAPADLATMRARLRDLPPKAVAFEWRADRPATREAGVLVPLVNLRGEAAVLFTVRSDALREHNGEVSFPGGKQDPRDLDVVQTALRETFEEIAIEPEQIDVLGTFAPLPNKSNTMKVTPVVGFLGDVDPAMIRFNDGEVAAVFALTVRQLRDPTLRKQRRFRETTFMHNAFLGGPVEVWGLTAFILEGVLAHVIPERLALEPPPGRAEA